MKFGIKEGIGRPRATIATHGVIRDVPINTKLGFVGSSSPNLEKICQIRRLTYSIPSSAKHLSIIDYDVCVHSDYMQAGLGSHHLTKPYPSSECGRRSFVLVKSSRPPGAWSQSSPVPGPPGHRYGSPAGAPNNPTSHQKNPPTRN